MLESRQRLLQISLNMSVLVVGITKILLSHILDLDQLKEEKNYQEKKKQQTSNEIDSCTAPLHTLTKKAMNESRNKIKLHVRLLRNYYSPRMEKKIMNPADICTTLLLPTRVKARRPAFSLQINQNKLLGKIILFQFI